VVVLLSEEIAIWFYVNATVLLVVIVFFILYISRSELRIYERIVAKLKKTVKTEDVQAKQASETIEPITVKPIEIDEEMKNVLMMTDDLLEKLPEEEIRRFVNSSKFDLYKEVIEKVKNIKPKETNKKVDLTSNNALMKNAKKEYKPIDKNTPTHTSLLDVKEEHNFKLKDGTELRNLEELLDKLKNMDKATFEHHVNEERNDFIDWIKDCVGDIELFEKVKATKSREKMILDIFERIIGLKNGYIR
jgi:regulator of sigma D